MSSLLAVSCGGELGSTSEESLRASDDPEEDSESSERARRDGGMPSAPESEEDSEDEAPTENSESEEPSAMADPATTEPLEVAGQTRIARLTHTQYDNTISDLLYLEVAPSGEFIPDPLFGGYNNNQNQLRVADRLGRDYRRSAETAAAAAVASAEAYAQLVPCEDNTCQEEFITTLGRRAYRRPLDADESQRYSALFEQGPDLVASGDDFKDGVQVVIEAMLQSPKFLYRTELSGANEAEPVTLGDYELAQRLSYLLWNTMPDDSLLTEADEGNLRRDLADIIGAMVEDERARPPMRDFHTQWLLMAKYDDLRKDDSFALFNPELKLQAESLRFIEHVGFELERGYETLMTAPFSFVDDGLAPLYGLEENFGQELQKTDLDDAVRAGLLTQIGFLAANSYASETSPIHRGVFINRVILCNEIPDPPTNLDLNASAPENPRTNREAVEQQTSPAACVGCHALINEPGFAFEGFDAVGRIREEDRGYPVDTSGELTLDGERVSFAGAIELVQAIGQSRQGRECFSRNLLRYAYGRQETPQDEAVITSLAEAMSSDEFSIKDALSLLTQSDDFLTRMPNED